MSTRARNSVPSNKAWFIKAGVQPTGHSLPTWVPEESKNSVSDKITHCISFSREKKMWANIENNIYSVEAHSTLLRLFCLHLSLDLNILFCIITFSWFIQDQDQCKKEVSRTWKGHLSWNRMSRGTSVGYKEKFWYKNWVQVRASQYWNGLLRRIIAEKNFHFLDILNSR